MTAHLSATAQHGQYGEPSTQQRPSQKHMSRTQQQQMAAQLRQKDRRYSVRRHTLFVSKREAWTEKRRDRGSNDQGERASSPSFPEAVTAAGGLVLTAGVLGRRRVRRRWRDVGRRRRSSVGLLPRRRVPCLVAHGLFCWSIHGSDQISCQVPKLSRRLALFHSVSAISTDGLRVWVEYLYRRRQRACLDAS